VRKSTFLVLQLIPCICGNDTNGTLEPQRRTMIEYGSHERGWIYQLCCLHEPPLVLVQMYPPVGDLSDHIIDAIVEHGSGRKIAVETTRCYRGDRSSGEARAEEDLLERFRTWLRRVAIEVLGDRGYRITFTVYLAEHRDTLIHRLKEFLRSAHLQKALKQSIERALRKAGSSKMAECVAAGDEATNLPVIGAGSTVRIIPVSPACPADVDWDLYECASGEWIRFISRDLWTDTWALAAGLQAKRAKLDQYRQEARKLGATEVWLLLVVEESSGWDLIGALRGRGSEALYQILHEEPQFDEVYLLAWHPRPPTELEQRIGQVATEPQWHLTRLWPEE
jgi:hypothetical protein